MFNTNSTPMLPAGENTVAARGYEVFDPSAVEATSDVCQQCECMWCHAS